MRILVSGAGMAGLSTGITLGAAGHDVSIVERAKHLRVNGSPIDIRGDAIKVADKMGVLDPIRARRVDMTERVQFVDSRGELLADLPDSEFNDSPTTPRFLAKISPTCCAPHSTRRPRCGSANRSPN